MGAIGVGVAIAFLLVAPGPLGLGLTSALQTGQPKAPSQCSVGPNPSYPAYDPVNGYIYVPNVYDANVTVVKAPCTVVATVGLPNGASPYAAAFDPSDNYVYVTDPDLNQVYVLSGTALIATLNGGWFSDPLGLTYDPAGAGMLVTNPGSDNVTGIIGFSLYSLITLSEQPEEIGIDPVYGGSVEVTLPFVDEFAALLPNEPFYGPPTTVYNWSTGSQPDQMAYDPELPGMFFTNTFTNNVTVFVSGGPYTTSVNVGHDPAGVCYSAVHQYMYVMDGGNNRVSEIGPGLTVVKTVKLASGAYPYGCAYDDATHQMYVTGFDSGQLYILS